ncbi:MAG: 6-bladed beta-propeller [Gemmatimonadetes bacterium]|nr:6-bladed beta-propeller [Gemmatimonadota bacterium]
MNLLTPPARFAAIARSTRQATVLALFLAPLAAPPAHGQDAANAPLREVREVLRLGDAVDVPDWLTFAAEPRLMLDASGRLFVVPGNDPRIRVLDSVGEFIRYIGNRGTGPGEFSYLYRTGFAGDTLWAQDMFAARTSFFDTTGAHIRTDANTGQPEMGSGYATKMPLAEGRQLVVGPPGEAGEGQRARMAVAIGPRDESRADTVASVLESTTMEIEGVGSFAHRLVAAPPVPARSPDGSGVVVVDWDIDLPDRVAVRRYGLNGRLTAESTLDFELREIPADVREAYIEEGIAMFRRTAEALPETVGRQVPANLRAAVIRGSIIPDYYPPIATVFVTHEGRVWLRMTASGEDDEVSDWLVVGPDGAPEFRVSAPPGVTFRAAQGDRVWGTGKTEMDIPYIVLYEVGPSRG